MHKKMTIQTPPQQGPRIDPKTARDIDVYRSKMVGGSLVGPIPAPVRTRLNERLLVLEASFVPATLDQLETVVSEMTVAYPSLRGYSETEALLFVRKYSNELLGSPLWAVLQACHDVSSGAVPGLDLDFPPTCPRLVNLVRAIAARFRQEAFELERLLSAPVEANVDSETRERISRGLDALRARLACIGQAAGGEKKS
jgi:hypothetical protein